jgi:hypothetical protein
VVRRVRVELRRGRRLVARASLARLDRRLRRVVLRPVATRLLRGPHVLVLRAGGRTLARRAVRLR